MPQAYGSIAHWDVDFAQDVRNNGTHVLFGECSVLEATPPDFNWCFWSLSVCVCVYVCECM